MFLAVLTLTGAVPLSFLIPRGCKVGLSLLGLGYFFFWVMVLMTYIKFMFLGRRVFAILTFLFNNLLIVTLG